MLLVVTGWAACAGVWSGVVWSFGGRMRRGDLGWGMGWMGGEEGGRGKGRWDGVGFGAVSDGHGKV